MQIDNKRKGKLICLENAIGIRFRDLNMLNQAFIHPSYTNEQNLGHLKNNQRLEFLGDAVLELVISHFLFDEYDYLTEGQMTKLRALTVCEPSLDEVARNLNLGSLLILGKGEENTGGRYKSSILADTLEALIGAIYIDQGLDTARSFILKNLEPRIRKAMAGEVYIDYKTSLQEFIQRQSTERVLYKTIKEEGPDHDKVFYVNVVWNGKILGEGVGRSKKEAEQLAAKEALERIQK